MTILAAVLFLASPCSAATAEEAMVASYTTAWKTLLAEASGISMADLEPLIEVKHTEISTWNSGKTFTVKYAIKTGWLTSDKQDQLMVWLHRSEDAYRHLPLPRDTWFSLPDLRTVVAKKVFVTTLGKIDPSAKPLYANLEEAKAFVMKKYSLPRLDKAEVAFYVPGKVPREDGAPYLLWSTVIDDQGNKCREGYLNLITGADESHENAIRFYGAPSGRGVTGRQTTFAEPPPETIDAGKTGPAPKSGTNGGIDPEN